MRKRNHVWKSKRRVAFACTKREEEEEASELQPSGGGACTTLHTEGFAARQPNFVVSFSHISYSIISLFDSVQLLILNYLFIIM